MDDETIMQVIRDVQGEFQREIEQGVLQHDLYKSTAALGGKDACDRILRRISFRKNASLRIEPRRKEKA